MPSRTRLVTLIALACSLAMLPACRVGGYSKPERENESLRTRVRDLSEQLALATAERDELRVKLKSSIESSAGPAAAPTAIEVAAATPKVVALEIDSFSGYIPADEKLPATGAVAYIRTLDGRRRFTQAVGTLVVEIWSSTNATHSSAAPLSRITLSPTQLREAYRSSITGTHYAVELLLPSPLARTTGTADTHFLRATFTDALTGESIHADYPLAPPPPPNPKGKKAV